MATNTQTEGSTLRELLDALDTAVVELLDAPAGDTVAIRSVALVDSSDLTVETDSGSPMQDMYLHVGIVEAEALQWLRAVGKRPVVHRPRAVLSKIAQESDAVRAAAHRAGVALVAVHQQARWDQVFPLVRRMLERARGQRSTTEAHDRLATDTDLFGLAQIVAQNAGGMVSIEDPHSHVLAYSASNEAADQLRILSILGREGPRDYLRILQKWGCSTSCVRPTRSSICPRTTNWTSNTDWWSAFGVPRTEPSVHQGFSARSGSNRVISRSSRTLRRCCAAHRRSRRASSPAVSTHLPPKHC